MGCFELMFDNHPVPSLSFEIFLLLTGILILIVLTFVEDFPLHQSGPLYFQDNLDSYRLRFHQAKFPQVFDISQANADVWKHCFQVQGGWFPTA